MNRRAFFGKAVAAIFGASFLSFDDSDGYVTYTSSETVQRAGLYPFQREGIEYLRHGKIYAPYVPLHITKI